MRKMYNINLKDMGWNDGIIMNNNIIYVPNSVELRKLVTNEIHKVPYARHPRYKKNY